MGRAASTCGRKTEFRERGRGCGRQEQKYTQRLCAVNDAKEHSVGPAKTVSAKIRRRWRVSRRSKDKRYQGKVRTAPTRLDMSQRQMAVLGGTAPHVLSEELIQSKRDGKLQGECKGKRQRKKPKKKKKKNPHHTHRQATGSQRHEQHTTKKKHIQKPREPKNHAKREKKRRVLFLPKERRQMAPTSEARGGGKRRGTCEGGPCRQKAEEGNRRRGDSTEWKLQFCFEYGTGTRTPGHGTLGKQAWCRDRDRVQRAGKKRFKGTENITSLFQLNGQRGLEPHCLRKLPWGFILKEGGEGKGGNESQRGVFFRGMEGADRRDRKKRAKPENGKGKGWRRRGLKKKSSVGRGEFQEKAFASLGSMFL